MPVQTDQLSIRGTAAQLGLTGERYLSVPLPAEVDQEKVVANIKSALASSVAT
jgi:HSP20 family molecular chaperone IbpA